MEVQGAHGGGGGGGGDVAAAGSGPADLAALQRVMQSQPSGSTPLTEAVMTIVSLLDMPRPFGPLKALDMDDLAAKVTAAL